MDVAELEAAARRQVGDDVWAYFQGTADGDLTKDARAWERWDLVPRVMTGLRAIDTSLSLQEDGFTAPVLLQPTASQGAVHSEGELATRRAAARAGLLVGYSFHATVEVERFADAADAPWWAQAYTMRDRTVSDGYLRRCAAAGAGAIVLTVDVPGNLADAPFRRLPMSAPVAERGNYPRDASGPVPVETESCIVPADITRTADIAGLPVWVKGVMTADDAHRAADAGAVGVIVSNHARRQLPGVAPTASVLRDVVAGVDGRVPVLVDGGIRSGTDVVRALALGARAVGIGRPVPWALAAGGQLRLERMISTLIDEIRVTMAAVGAGSLDEITDAMIRPAFV